MAIRISNWLNKKYPQNILIKKPFIGTLIFLVSCIGFAIIYKPFQVHESRFFNFELTMAIYFLLGVFPLFGIVKLLKRIRYFSNPADWTILKEVLSIVISLLGVGISVYFSGFILETPGERWNLPTFFNSVIIAFMIGLVPFMFFTFINYRYLLVVDIIKNYSVINSPSPEKAEEMLHISSQLKKEELDFYPAEFIYAESDGNYTLFYLDVDNQVRKRIIRNSISNIEQQLSLFTFLFRTHRAFIVNVKKVTSQKGNTLGYRLLLSGVEAEIPVSRQKTREFDQIMKQYH